jgi:aryl-alcohol dehydrogenase-like predicted oxidoreductase
VDRRDALRTLIAAGAAQVETSPRLMDAGRMDLMQVHSLVDIETQLATLRRLEDAGRRRAFYRLAAERRVAVLVNRPFAQGGLFDKVKGKPLPQWAASFAA